MSRLPSNLPEILRAAGLTVVEHDGWETRGRPASTGGFAPVGVLCHHTATKKSVPNANVIALLIRGRSDLPGPLCNMGLDRAGVVHMIAAGRANHAGKAKASGTVKAGDGNQLYIGIEAFNDGVGEPWPAVQMSAYALLCATLSTEVTHNSSETVRGHKETSVTGKIDPTFSMPQFRVKVKAAMTKTPAKPKPKPKPHMIWKGKTLTPDSPIPKTRPAQHHWSAKVGDRLTAWEDVGANGALDGNLTPGKGHIYFLHWPDPQRNGYTKIMKNGKAVPMTPAQLKRPVHLWNHEDVKRWRDKHGQAPMTIYEGLRWAVKHHVLIAMEPKGPLWASNPRWYAIVRDACRKSGHPAWVKRLASTSTPKSIVTNAHKAKVQIAAIYGSKIKGARKRRAQTARVQKGWGSTKFDATW